MPAGKAPAAEDGLRAAAAAAPITGSAGGGAGVAEAAVRAAAEDKAEAQEDGKFKARTKSPGLFACGASTEMIFGGLIPQHWRQPHSDAAKVGR